MCLVDRTENVDEIIQGGPKIRVNKGIKRLVFLDLKDNIFI